jgi:hypothetical protein
MAPYEALYGRKCCFPIYWDKLVHANMCRRNLKFAKGNKLFLRVAPMKGVTRFGKKGKLNPRYIGPFEILKRVGLMAYRLALLPELANIHNVFQVFMLRKYISDPSHVIKYELLQLEGDLAYEEVPIRVLDLNLKETHDN